jgi:hypothetical protein
MKEIRYALLIGMNNYKKNPLSYSFKDVEDIREALVNYCKFKTENIFLIGDFDMPIRTQLQKGFEAIQKKFRANSDLFFFYYSGHGEYDQQQEKSSLLLSDDTSIGIGEVVLKYFEPLKAKNQYLIIDACHSGKNIYIKPKGTSIKKERKLLNDSKELYFLFAAEEHRKAYQNDKLKNSYYTYYFLEAIKNNSLYDDDGWLTMNSIDEYIRKKLSTHADLVQIPGSESRTTGYKPFAFVETKTKKEIQTITISKEKMKPILSSNFDLGESLTYTNRQKIQEQLKKLLRSEFEHFPLTDFLKDTYEIKNQSGYGNIPPSVEHELEERIITKAKRDDLDAIKNSFEIKVGNKPRRKTGLSAMFDMLHGEPEPEVNYRIKQNESIIVSAFIELKAKDYKNVSGGVLCLFYQSKYGFVFCKALFKYDWDGTDEMISKFIKVDLVPFLLKEDNVAEAQKELNSALHELIENLKKWNEIRENEIRDFISKAR